MTENLINIECSYCVMIKTQLLSIEGENFHIF